MAFRNAARSDADIARLLERAHEAHSRGEYAQAERRYKAILERDPDRADALHLLGFLNYQLGRSAQALRYLAAAMARSGRSPDLLSNFGLVLHSLGRNEEALDAYDAALVADPDNPDLLNRRGVACSHLDRAAEALAGFDRALLREPGNAAVLGNRGNALLKLNRLDDAIASYDAAMLAGGDTAALLTNRAHVLRRQGRLEESLADLERALALQPDFAEAEFELGLVWLTLGDYQKGWAHYERRWDAAALKDRQRNFKSPCWNGEQSLQGRTILLHAEQGFGDTIQFVRYVPLVLKRGARVALEVQPELRRLLSGMPGVERVLARGDKLPSFDFHCPLMSLPRAFGTRVETIPASVPYLSIGNADDTGPVGALPADKPLIGVCWAGEKTHRNDANRSIPLAVFAKLWDGIDPHIVSLRYQPDGEERAFLRTCGNVTDASPWFDDFADTARLISRLDVVVTVDTAVAHLAAAMAVPTVVMVPLSADFRWLRVRDDSPWYPTVTLFRQRYHNQWEPVVAVVREHLLRRFSGL